MPETVKEFWARVKATCSKADRRLLRYTANWDGVYPVACRWTPGLYREAAELAAVGEHIDLNEFEDELGGMLPSAAERLYWETLRQYSSTSHDESGEPIAPCGILNEMHRERAKKRGGCTIMQDWQWRALVRAYDGRCAYCGERAKLTLDHVEPISAGGDHAIWNAAPACKSCNSSKNSKSLEKWCSDDDFGPSLDAVEQRMAEAHKRLVEDIGEKWFSPSTYGLGD